MQKRPTIDASGFFSRLGWGKMPGVAEADGLVFQETERRVPQENGCLQRSPPGDIPLKDLLNAPQLFLASLFAACECSRSKPHRHVSLRITNGRLRFS